jgi:hypothetical protein
VNDVTVSYWIQEADFETAEFDPVDVSGALEAFEAHDWFSSLSKARRLESEGVEHCPPGIGFVASDGRVLHICPSESNDAVVHYHFSVESRFLGLISRERREIRTAEGFAMLRVPDLLQQFFAADHQRIITTIDSSTA